jgi:hypothetical protein
MEKSIQRGDPPIKMLTSEYLAIVEGIKRQNAETFKFVVKTATEITAKLWLIYGELQYIAGAASAGVGTKLTAALAGRDETLGAALTGLSGLLKKLPAHVEIDVTPIIAVVSAHINAIQNIERDGGESLRAVVAEYGGDRTKQILEGLSVQIDRIGRPAIQEELTVFIAESVLEIQKRHRCTLKAAATKFHQQLEAKEKLSNNEQESLAALTFSTDSIKYVYSAVSRYKSHSTASLSVDSKRMYSGKLK